jgi:hypothetical protein
VTDKQQDQETNPEFVGLGLEECECCGKPAWYTIMLVDHGDGEFFIPNQSARAVEGTGLACIRQVPFCHPCIRAIEDNLRATIDRLTPVRKHSQTKHTTQTQEKL